MSKVRTSSGMRNDPHSIWADVPCVGDSADWATKNGGLPDWLARDGEEVRHGR